MTETCTHCGQQIGDRELRHVWILGGDRYVFHVKKEPNCKEEWRNANKELIAGKLASYNLIMWRDGMEGSSASKVLLERLNDFDARLKQVENELGIRALKGSKKKDPGRSVKKVEK